MPYLSSSAQRQEIRIGEISKLLDEHIDTEDSRDQSALRLAIMVGMIGIVFTVVLSFVTELIWFLHLESDAHTTHEISYQLAALRPFYFASSIFTSVGFVSVFAMKKSNLGIIFPLMVYTSFFGYPLFLRAVFEAGLGSSELFIGSSYVLGFSLTVLGGILLLTLRRVSKNPLFLTGFAVIYMAELLIAYLVFMLAFGGPVQITSGLDHVIASLPDFTLSLILSILTIVFFMIESKQPTELMV